MLTIHSDSHTDHAIPTAVVEHVLALFADRDSFFIETLTYGADLPAVPCGLHVGVPDSECFREVRGDRAYSSRLCNRAPRMVREVTIIAGPHSEDADAGMVVYTMFGGPLAPKEPGDTCLSDEERPAAEAFWADAALSAG